MYVCPNCLEKTVIDIEKVSAKTPSKIVESTQKNYQTFKIVKFPTVPELWAFSDGQNVP
jgi:hypothetical protein